jgi:hypothetical protein
MNPKDIRSLQEAYLDVYAPQENIEEGLRSAVKRLLGGGKKEAEAPKPESRGEQLRKKYNVGPEKSDTSAKRQILDRSRAKAEKDEKDYGDKPFQKQVANQSKSAHDRYLKAGYSKYGADDARGRGSKAAKRAESLNKEQVDLYDIILSHLLDEKYKELPVDKMRGKVIKHAASGVKKAITPHFKGTKGTTEGNVDDAKAKKSLNKAQKIQGEIKDREALGKDFYAGSKIGRSKFKGKNVNKEQVDLYDIILSHLLDEGYASTEESADKIILNMSESWFEQIVEDHVVVKKDGSREIVKGDPPKPEVKSGGYDYTHTDDQKKEMKKSPKTKIGSRFD